MNTLINPSDVIDYNRSAVELELFWFFCLVVAGKTAKTQARLLDNFLQSLDPADPKDDTPFTRVALANDQGVLLEKIKESRLGQFNRLVRSFSESVDLNLRRCTVADLEAIHGVGPKTARMFVMMSRENQRHAALDTHVLKHLRANGIDAPTATPSAGKTYDRLEKEFLKLVDASDMTVADYDLMVWRSYADK